jgi:hypothetical protein
MIIVQATQYSLAAHSGKQVACGEKALYRATPRSSKQPPLFSSSRGPWRTVSSYEQPWVCEWIVRYIVLLEEKPTATIVSFPSRCGGSHLRSSIHRFGLFTVLVYSFLSSITLMSSSVLTFVIVGRCSDPIYELDLQGPGKEVWVVPLNCPPCGKPC